LWTGWRLATIGELSGLNNEPCLANINGIATYIGYYWSSNEISSNYAEQICLYLSSWSCGSSGNYKYDSKRVICTKNL
jgi:hypothetical protein